MHNRTAPTLLMVALLIGACHPTSRDVAQLAAYKQAKSGTPLREAAGCGTGQAIDCDAVHLTCAELHIVRNQACRALAATPALPLGCPQPTACIENALNSATALLPQTADDRFRLTWDRLEIADGRLKQLGDGQADQRQCERLKEARTLATLAGNELDALKPELDKALAADPAVAEQVAIARRQAQVLPVKIDLALNAPTRNCRP